MADQLSPAGGAHLEDQFPILLCLLLLSSMVELLLVWLAVVYLIFFLSLFQSIYYGVIWYCGIALIPISFPSDECGLYRQVWRNEQKTRDE